MEKPATRPFHCRICNISFSRQDHVSRHMASNHGILRYACTLCGLTTARRDGLRRHMAKIHGTKLPPSSSAPLHAEPASASEEPPLILLQNGQPPEDKKFSPTVWKAATPAPASSTRKSSLIFQRDSDDDEKILPLPLSLPFFTAAKLEQTPVPSNIAEPHVPVQADVKALFEPDFPAASVSQPSLRPIPAAAMAAGESTPTDYNRSINLKWNAFASNMSSIMPNLLEDEKFVDVTLACDGKYIKCHKVILGACSPYFEELLSANPCQHPIIIMKDFQFWEIRAIVDFIYCGSVNIPQHNLPQLLQVANVLQIKGLTGMQSYTVTREVSDAHLLDEASTKTANNSSFSPSQDRKLRKRPELPQNCHPESTEVPMKKKKLSSRAKKKLISSCTNTSIESYISDESSNQSETSQINSSLSDPLGPTPLLQPVCIKEETRFHVDDPPDRPYRHCRNTTKGTSSQPGQFQLLTLPSSRNFKEEVFEDLTNSTDEDPLDLKPVVS